MGFGKSRLSTRRDVIRCFEGKAQRTPVRDVFSFIYKKREGRGLRAFMLSSIHQKINLATNCRFRLPPENTRGFRKSGFPLVARL